jgi:hypothetical protein
MSVLVRGLGDGVVLECFVVSRGWSNEVLMNFVEEFALFFTLDLWMSIASFCENIVICDRFRAPKKSWRRLKGEELC